MNPVTESSEEVSHGWRLRTETTKGSVEPAHYKKFTIEPFDFIHKNGIEDLEKAVRYLQLLIVFETVKEKNETED